MGVLCKKTKQEICQNFKFLKRIQIKSHISDLLVIACVGYSLEKVGIPYLPPVNKIMKYTICNFGMKIYKFFQSKLMNNNLGHYDN